MLTTTDKVKLTFLAGTVLIGTALYVYANSETIFASQNDMQHHGALLTKIALRLQSASYRAKKNLIPMTRKDIDNIMFLETQLYNKEHSQSIKVKAALSDLSNNAAVKQITLFTALTKTTAKIYCR